MFECSIHAEMDLLSKMGKKAKGSKFYLYRFNNSSNKDARKVKNAKPCIMCQHMLKVAGVSRVFYVDDCNKVCVLKKNDMSEMVGEPRNITKYFLNRHYEEFDSYSTNGRFNQLDFCRI